jgi:hypothetical protein
MGEGKKVYRDLVGKSEGKNLLEVRSADGRMGKNGFKETVREGAEWIRLAQDRDG